MHGRGIWKLNCELLKDLDYVNKINNVITQEKIVYVLPIYHMDYIKNNENDDEIRHTIIINLFFRNPLS